MAASAASTQRKGLLSLSKAGIVALLDMFADHEPGEFFFFGGGVGGLEVVCSKCMSFWAFVLFFFEIGGS